MTNQQKLKRKFAYFGTPYVARDTLAFLVEKGFVPSVVVTSPDAYSGRGLELLPCPTKEWALAQSFQVETPEKLDEAFVTKMKAKEYEYAIVVAYGKIIPQALIDAFPLGIINIHYSLLPKYRGASPVESVLLHGESVTGVTIQQMVYELDAGDILAVQEVVIGPSETTRELRPRLITEGAKLLCKVLPEFEAGTIVPVAQDGARATRAPKIKKEEGLLFLSGDTQLNWSKYRAYAESPGTYFFAKKGDKKVRVKIVTASFENKRFAVLRVVPEGKSEQDLSQFLQNGWIPQ
jgi:methionyl-tRNA formyltransferase